VTDEQQVPERLTPEQGLVAMGAAMGREVALNVEDRQLAQRIMRETGAVFARAIEQARAEAERRALEDPEPEPEGTIVGTVRALMPDELRARRWID
jgi:hypothetical protein